jgi:protein-tyrosine-phosphatase
MNESKTKTVLFVCTGNTCRSPMAVGLLRKLAGRDTYRILSAGTGASQGMPPSLYAKEVMEEEEGIDISGHRSQMLDGNMLEEADTVLVMAQTHRQRVTEWFRSYAGKVRLLREFDPVQEDPDYPNIPDPMGQRKEAYVQCKEMIKRSLERAIREL